MTPDQRIVAIGAPCGIVAMLGAMTGLYHLWPVDPALGDVGRRLAYTVQANAVAILPLLAAIVSVGNRRFLTPAIDPTLGKEDRATTIDTRVADNTLQQFMLFLVGSLALSVHLSADQMRAIPAAVILFV